MREDQADEAGQGKEYTGRKEPGCRIFHQYEASEEGSYGPGKEIDAVAHPGLFQRQAASFLEKFREGHSHPYIHSDEDQYSDEEQDDVLVLEQGESPSESDSGFLDGFFLNGGKGEPEQVVRVFRDELDANLVYVDATDRFLDKLAGVADPEQKRKIIGAEFIRVFEEEARKLSGISFLAQGTIYPDIVESGPVKSHHNVGGLPEDLQFELVEPIKLLFKDEVRVVGKQLGLPDNMVFRQPFPGPGLGVRCTGAITRDRLEALRESDAILREEFAKNGLEGKVWQYFTIVPDYKSTGVKDNKRSWDWPVIIRAVNTRDAMTATIEEIPYALLHHITQRIITEVPGVNRVLYDLTPKPTGTIEWE